ncbi:MAG: hypothetical protein AVDCRST_MAG93-2038 [uncultured Chloroflexia bacterium]|uniref:Uncharacterized protein n=1 Tax=uncultured Chloroflexia bacterium TaxID=1672391 RepID=A0A6J4IS89_9CHLR|nr:MAG: hypothetical protein AVDCRST_MAG93-2038 [uncultured Chloroflexia bacterium]
MLALMQATASLAVSLSRLRAHGTSQRFLGFDRFAITSLLTSYSNGWWRLLVASRHPKASLSSPIGTARRAAARLLSYTFG